MSLVIGGYYSTVHWRREENQGIAYQVPDSYSDYVAVGTESMTDSTVGYHLRQVSRSQWIGTGPTSTLPVSFDSKHPEEAKARG